MTVEVEPDYAAERSSALVFAQSDTDVYAPDLNHDGRLDIETANFYGAGVSVLLGAGDGTFGAAKEYGMNRKPGTVVVADFNGDGHPDIATGSNDGGPAVRNGRGDGTFGRAHYLEWLFAAGGAVADFNLDGRPDLAFGTTENDSAKVFLNWTGLPEPPCLVVDVTDSGCAWRGATSATATAGSNMCAASSPARRAGSGWCRSARGRARCCRAGAASTSS